MSQREGREQLEAIWLDKLYHAERRCRAAIAQTRKIQAESTSIPPSDANFALQNALKLQNRALDEYAALLNKFTRLVVFGERPDESGFSIREVEVESATDLDIQEWVFKHHGFVPHPSWIAHCRELYLGTPTEPRSPGQDCPPEKRMAIREVFVELGILGE